MEQLLSHNQCCYQCCFHSPYQEESAHYHVDVVWDTYIARRVNKEGARKRNLESRNKISRNWPNFLRDSMNKQELFAFLSDKIAPTEGKQIFATSGSTVMARGTISHCMEMCDHEEAGSSPARCP